MSISVMNTLRPLFAALALLVAAGLLVQFLQQRLARPLLTSACIPK